MNSIESPMISIEFSMITIHIVMITIECRMMTINLSLIAINRHMMTINILMIAINRSMITIERQLIDPYTCMISIKTALIAIECFMNLPEKLYCCLTHPSLRCKAHLQPLHANPATQWLQKSLSAPPAQPHLDRKVHRLKGLIPFDRRDEEHKARR